MEWSSHASARTEQLSERTARVDFTLDLNTFGALDAGRLHDDLNARREQIRGKIFHAISDHVVPAVGQITGQPLENPESWKVSSKHQAHSSWLAPQVRHGRLATDHRMDLHFDFEADRAMNAATMLRLGREQVGMAVADSFVHSLDQHFFGKEESSGRWQTGSGPGGAGEPVYEPTETPAAAQDAPQQAPHGWPQEAANEANFNRAVPGGEQGTFEDVPWEADNDDVLDFVAHYERSVRQAEAEIAKYEQWLRICQANRAQALNAWQFRDTCYWWSTIANTEAALAEWRKILMRDRACLARELAREERERQQASRAA
jgi:hypothetical protein